MTSKMSCLAALLFVVAAVSARSAPPSPSQSALMARYVVNQADYTSIATLSVRENTKNYPFVNIVSSSDGTLGKGSGVPYIFLTPLDFTGQDLEKDDRATLMMSLVQGSFCKEKGYDPMDPRCARVIMSGRIKKVSNGDADYEDAKKAIFERHEWLSHMPENHHFFFAKLEIETIVVLANFGYPKYVTVDEYFGANDQDVEEYALRYR